MMSELSCQEESQCVSRLSTRSIAWFAQHHQQRAETLFYQYYLESCSGDLGRLYAGLVRPDPASVARLIPLISARLTPTLAGLLAISAFKVRCIINMAVYWIAQFHSGMKEEVPDPHEALDVFSGILRGQFLKIG